MVWLQRLMMTTLWLLPVLKEMTICGFVHNELNQTQYELLCDATRSLLIVIASRLHATSGHAGGFMKLKQKKLMLTQSLDETDENAADLYRSAMLGVRNRPNAMHQTRTSSTPCPACAHFGKFIAYFL
jgi:hypothetical protein